MIPKIVKVIPATSLLFIMLLAMLSVPGCSPIMHGSARLTPRIAPTAAPSAPADVAITATQYNRKIAIKLGQTLLVEVPDRPGQWSINFGINHLSLLLPSNNMNLSKGNGWLLRAMATGETQITLTSIVHCSSPQPCPLMPQTFIFTVHVE